jgi:hypothetical protein
MDGSASTNLFALLNRLDADENIAAGKYLTLRSKIIKKLMWNGCPEFKADDLADKILDLTVNLTIKCHYLELVSSVMLFKVKNY